jgi:hypothetical protein
MWRKGVDSLPGECAMCFEQTMLMMKRMNWKHERLRLLQAPQIASLVTLKNQLRMLERAKRR